MTVFKEIGLLVTHCERPVNDYEIFPRMLLEKGTSRKFTHLHLFPASGPLEFIAVDILGPLLKTLNFIPAVLVVTDRYPKLIRALPTSRKTASQIASPSINIWTVPFGIRKHILMDNRTRLVSKLFKTL